MKTIIEPFRTKVVEPIRFSTEHERKEILETAGYNLFQIKAEDTIIDFLTDSGTSALSSVQWAGMMIGDESYAGCTSWFKFEKSVQEIFGFPFVIPVHQGRAAERIFFAQTVKPGDIVPSNTHFDTTRANIEVLGATALDLPSTDKYDELFRGNIDITALTELLEKNGDKVPFIMITVTNNAVGGQPVSMRNISMVSSLAKKFHKPLIIDAARFAENAFLIKVREEGMNTSSVRSIAKIIFSFADACLMSAKKDGLSNMGGFIALREEGLAEQLKNNLIITEGFPTYGGLAGRDLESIAAGLWEATDEDYLTYRHASASYLANGLILNNVPIVRPPGLHAIYLNAREFLAHLSPAELPGQALVCELYLEAGIRACEIGTVMFGKTREDGLQEPARQDLVRLALPRRVYSQSHYDYVIEACRNVYERRNSISGMKICSEAPHLRHFTAKFEPLKTPCLA